MEEKEVNKVISRLKRLEKSASPKALDLASELFLNFVKQYCRLEGEYTKEELKSAVKKIKNKEALIILLEKIEDVKYGEAGHDIGGLITEMKKYIVDLSPVIQPKKTIMEKLLIRLRRKK